MSSFGGIWRDGAVVDPSNDCYDSDGQLVALGKKSGLLTLISRRSNVIGEAAVKGWLAEFFWLDVRIPKMLSPKEAFDLLKIFRPGLVRIRKGNGNYARINIEDMGSDHSATPIAWGKEDVYTPPKEELPQSWIPLTRSNYRKYIHSRCRFGRGVGPGVEGTLIGISENREHWIYETMSTPNNPSRFVRYSPMVNGGEALESPAKAKEAEELAKLRERLTEVCMEVFRSNRAGMSRTVFEKE